jgi:hypothetical protein
VFWVQLIQADGCDDRIMTNTESVVAPLRQALHGLLSRSIVDHDDRQLLEAIDAKAGRRSEAYSALSDSSAGMIELAKEIEQLHRQLTTIAAKYHA